MDLLLETGSPLENNKKPSGISFVELLDHAPIGIHCVDAQGIIQWANRTQLNMLGYEQDEYIGHPLAKFHVNAALFDDLMQQLQKGQALQSHEVRLWHKDGSIKIGALHSNAVWEDGKFVHTRCFTRDITGVIDDGKIKETLYLLIDSLQRATSLQDVYDAALVAIEKSLQCHRSSILLFDQTRCMRFVASRGLSDSYQEAVDGHSPWTPESTNPAPITIDDIDTTTLISDELKQTVKREGIRAMAFIPLILDGNLIGKFMTYFDMPFRFGPDHIDLCLSIARQVSFSVARKQAEQTLAQHASQLALVTNIAPVYIAQCDRDSRYKFVNQPHAQRFGLNAIDLKGRHIAEVLGNDAYAVIKPHVELVLEGKLVEFDMMLSEPGRGERFVHCWYVPEINVDGAVTGWVAAVADITERKRIEQALRDREDELKEADRRKDEFLAMLSHELRNPLAPIANAAHILRAAPADSAAFNQARAIIERQTARLARLVDDLFEVSRISTGRIKLNMERIAALGIIERSVETVRPLVDQHRHTLTMSLPEQTIWLDADSARLEQVFVNLLTNACKYTDEGGVIELSAEIGNTNLVVRVRDNGIGISAELLPRVFDLFTQAERTLDRAQGGLGIGLALVNTLVALHAGTVTAESTERKGSTFTVTLPIANAPTSASNTQPGSSVEAASSLRILVADDNADAAKSLAILLEASGHRIWIAHDGRQALQLAGQCQPHIAFLDIGLPAMDGYELVKQLRDSTCRDTVCVAITGYGQATDRERALNAGFNEHLVKPVDFTTLEHFIKNATTSFDKKSVLKL